MQQRPTCTNVRIRSTRDAHKIFFAVQHHMLPMITRRLDADERLALCSGCVYAWEERGPHTEITGLGIERFTEGRRWSPSRVRDEFLFYYEKYTPPADASHSSSSDKQPPRDWDPLVKQTYSVWVETEKGRRKWHLTAYFTQATVDRLGTIDDVSGVAELVVPDGTFQSTRVSKNRKGDDTHSRSDVLKAPSSSVTRTYAAFPAAYPVQPSHYPGPSASAFSNEPYRPVTQASHSSTFRHSSDTPQYSVPPPPLPPLGALHILPPLRSESEDVEYKFRRSSVPGIPDYQLSAFDRRASMDYSSSPLISSVASSGGRRTPLDHHSRSDHYSPIPAPSPLTRPGAGLPGSSVPSDRGSEHSALPCTCASSSRELPGSQPTLGRPSSTVGAFQPIQKDSDGEGNLHTYSPHTTPPVYSPPHNASQISLPPPAQLLRSGPSSQLYEVPSSSEHAASGSEPPRVDLAPLHSLQRRHPYYRDPMDDKALRLLGPRSG
ncbi:hypothetical protein BDN67DRAFT_959250 [Paxillus ammoniavirescens]|nr:hypothetical protein BDN67DRAFT_959250 [Paxillus ammoniavirescens]